MMNNFKVLYMFEKFNPREDNEGQPSEAAIEFVAFEKNVVVKDEPENAFVPNIYYCLIVNIDKYLWKVGLKLFIIVF